MALIADVERQSGDLEKAAEHLRKALAILEEPGLGEHPNLLIYWLARGRLELVQGEDGAAQKSFERAVELADIFYDEKHPKRIAAAKELAALGDVNSQ